MTEWDEQCFLVLVIGISFKTLGRRNHQSDTVSATLTLDSTGPSVDIFERNTWDSWENVFNSAGPFDGLVNCAGIRTRNLIVDTTFEEFQRHMDVNVTGTWLGIREMFRHRASKSESTSFTPASIVNIASVNAVIAVPAQAHYVASKTAVVGLTKAAAIEGAPIGIRVNAIAPGPFPTKGAWERLLPGDLKDKFDPSKKVPLKRVGEHHELANLAAYLVSDFSSYINGEVITIDGGEWLKGAGQFNNLEKVSDEMWDFFSMIRKKK